MRVLLIHNFYKESGGEDSVFFAEKNLLESKGNDVETLTFSNQTIKSFTEKLSASKNIFFNRRSAKLLQKKIDEVLPEIIHVHNFFYVASPSIFYVAKRNNIPVVLTLHNYRLLCPGGIFLKKQDICEKCLNGSLLNAIRYKCFSNSFTGTALLSGMISYHRLINTLQKKIDVFITLTNFSKTKFIEGGISSDKIMIKPNFNKSTETEYPKKREKYALFIGRISTEKGIDLLLNCWENINYPLKIIGRGPLMNKLDNQSNRNIIYLGEKSQDEVYIEMIKAQFLVFPSQCYEGFPMVIVEAFSHGLPVLASNLGSMKEIIKDKFTGILFDQSDLNDMRKKVDWAIKHPRELQEMGKRAFISSKKDFSAMRNYDLLLNIYQKAISINRMNN
jgi:glycosyltransferase involved in cell wall biosynthesis